MKHYGIITHYDVHNHGALLQLTALIRYLSKKNIEAKALQFDKNYDFIDSSIRAKYQISIKSIPVYTKFIKERGIGNFLYNMRKRKTLEQFKSNNGLIGDYYTSIQILDGVIVGSDEVFALHTGVTPLFWGHCLPSDHIISYGGSFGPTTLGDIERLHCVELISSGLKSMDGVSVRDKNSADIVEHLINQRPEIVIDPVLLYGYNDEIAMMKPPQISDYLVVYAYDNRMNSPEEVNAIRAYAKSKGLTIVSPGFYHKWCDININIDPISLLTYFKHATEVITDTFHGCVMSIITNAKFVVKTRESNHFKLNSLLSEYNLENRIFHNWNDIDSCMSPEINYVDVEKILNDRRRSSSHYLDSMIL